MKQRVQVDPAVLRWAIERSRMDLAGYRVRFPRLEAWLLGQESPTLKQLEAFARATHTPIGFLLLPAPPAEQVPIPDFRTVANRESSHPSPNLLETIYVCQQRQEWYREFARLHGESTLSFVGSGRVGDDVIATARRMRNVLGVDLSAQRGASTWTDALRLFIEQSDASGILVMCSGVVLNNNARPLDPGEFRGFALVDDVAPVVFINGADTKSAQMFTLAHELAHVWVGQTAVSDADARRPAGHVVEKWCNRVAAEFLVPISEFRREYRRDLPLAQEVPRLARAFKVSTLVVLRRMHDTGGLSRERLGVEYQKEVDRLASLERGTGGNFYLTQAARVSKRFARALVMSTLEGQTLYRDAFRMLGFSRVETLQKLGVSLGLV